MPLTAHPIPEEVVEHARQKLGHHFAPGEPGECWIFPRKPNAAGYGYVYTNGRKWSATRLAILLDGRQLGTSDLVCHRCDNPLCINPDHLFVGSPSDNMADMYAKGRHKIRKVRARPEYCKKCGHHRTDDVAAQGRTPARCRACAKKRARESSARRRALTKAQTN